MSTALAELKRQGLIRHIGLSNITRSQLSEAQTITEILCVQNFYNVAQRRDDAFVGDLARQGIAYVPFFPTGRVHSTTVLGTRRSGELTSSYADAACARLASTALAQQPVDPGDIIPQASSREPSGFDALVSAEALANLNPIGKQDKEA